MADVIPYRLSRTLQHELAPGERVMWQARPAPLSRALVGASTFLFGIPFFVFAASSLWGILTGRIEDRGPGWSSYVVLGAFVIIGAMMLLTPVWEWWVARHTLYAVTDRRALLIEAPPWRTSVRAFAPEQLVYRVRREDFTGRGALIFAREVVGSGRGKATREVGFFGLADAQHVERLLPMSTRVPEPAAAR